MRSMRPWRLDRPPKLLRFRPAQQTCLPSPPRLWVSLVSSPPRPRANPPATSSNTTLNRRSRSREINRHWCPFFRITSRQRKSHCGMKIAKGVMCLVQEQRAKKKYTIRDADTEARQVIVEFPAQEGWEMTKGTPKPEESSASFHRFRVPVEAGKSAELTVESFHPLETTYELTNLDSDEVALLVQQKRLTPVMQQSFNRILAQKDKIGGIDQQINQRKQESDQITADQNRIRENMKALKGSSEERSLLQRYTKQLDSQEDRIATLRRETDGLRKQRDTAQAELGLMIMDVNVDESFLNTQSNGARPAVRTF